MTKLSINSERRSGHISDYASSTGVNLSPEQISFDVVIGISSSLDRIDE